MNMYVYLKLEMWSSIGTELILPDMVMNDCSHCKKNVFYKSLLKGEWSLAVMMMRADHKILWQSRNAFAQRFTQAREARTHLDFRYPMCSERFVPK